jgi:FdhD protein
LTLYVDKQNPDADDAGRRAGGAAIQVFAQPAADRPDRDIISVQVDWDVHAVAINTRSGLKDLDAKLGKRTTTSGCGQGTVFGELMDEIDSVKLPAGAQMTRSTLYALLDRVRLHETIYKQAGAVHGCALATNDDGAGRSCISSRMSAATTRSTPSPADVLDRVDGGDKFSTPPAGSLPRWSSRRRRWAPFLVCPLGADADGLKSPQTVGITMIGRATGKHFLLFTGGSGFAPKSDVRIPLRVVSRLW